MTMRWMLLVTVLAMTGCASPMLVFPGKSLKGEETTTNDFAFAADYTLMQLEANPGKPYSVWLRVVSIEGELYLDAAPGRKWHKHIQADPDIRIALGEKIYPARAVRVEDPALAKRFLPGRTIYRIEPR